MKKIILLFAVVAFIGVLSVPYVPGILDQISDRLSRIGQKCAVNAYVFI